MVILIKVYTRIMHQFHTQLTNQADINDILITTIISRNIVRNNYEYQDNDNVTQYKIPLFQTKSME